MTNAPHLTTAKHSEVLASNARLGSGQLAPLDPARSERVYLLWKPGEWREAQIEVLLRRIRRQ
jgi:hypothetical protein